MNDFHAFKSTSTHSNKCSGGGGFGCGWVVIVVVVCSLLFFIFNGASGEAIEGLLFWGVIAFLFAKCLFR